MSCISGFINIKEVTSFFNISILLLWPAEDEFGVVLPRTLLPIDFPPAWTGPGWNDRDPRESFDPQPVIVV